MKINEIISREGTVDESASFPFAGAKVGQKAGPAGQLKGTDPKGYPKGKLVGGAAAEGIEQDEDDEPGSEINPGNPIPYPKGTTEIDVSDTLDWYNLGMKISDLDDAKPEEFNQGPPHTVMVFPNDELEQPYLKQFKRLGFKFHDRD